MLTTTFRGWVESALLENDNTATEKLIDLIEAHCLSEAESLYLLAEIDKLDFLKISQAYFFRGLMHLYGICGERDYKSALDFFERATINKNAYADYYLGYMHLYGKAEYDPPAAIRYFDRAIAMNNALAMCHRAFMHLNGIGGKEDFALAMILYDRAINQNYLPAMIGRAYMHMYGLGEPKNYPAAIELFIRAIKKCYDSDLQNIRHMIAESPHEIPPKSIYQLILTPQLSDVAIPQFLQRKKEVFEYICTLPEEECFVALNNCLKPGHPLLKFMSMQKHWLKQTLLEPIRPDQKGTVLNLIAEKVAEMKLKRESAKPGMRYLFDLM